MRDTEHVKKYLWTNERYLNFFAFNLFKIVVSVKKQNLEDISKEKRKTVTPGIRISDSNAKYIARAIAAEESL